MVKKTWEEKNVQVQRCFSRDISNQIEIEERQIFFILLISPQRFSKENVPSDFYSRSTVISTLIFSFFSFFIDENNKKKNFSFENLFVFLCCTTI